jgi:lysyl-tRNA synthetase class 1
VAERAAAFRLAFAHVAFLIQQPAVDVPAIAAAEKGSPLTAVETELLAERTAAARRWLDTYAPDEARVAVRTDGVPPDADALDEAQGAFLVALADRATGPDAPVTGPAWQALIFETAKALDQPAGRAFAALYAAFLGRASGPRAGWLLASLDRTFVIDRLREASGRAVASGEHG